MHNNKDTKIGDTQQAPDGRLYYYDGLILAQNERWRRGLGM